MLGQLARFRLLASTESPGIALFRSSCWAGVNFDTTAFRSCGLRFRLFVPLSTIELVRIPLGPWMRATMGSVLPTMMDFRLVLYQSSERTLTVWNAPV